MKIMLFANTDWYLFNFRLSLAQALKEQGHEVLLISPDGPYGKKLKDLGFRWRAAPMERRSLNPLREAALILWLRKLMDQEDIDLVHGFTIKNAVYGALAARLAGTKGRVSAVTGMGYVFTSEDALARALRPVLRALFRLALSGRNARLILQNPDDVEIFCKARLVDPANIRLIMGSGVNCEKFIPARSDANDRPFTVLFPARLLWDKGLAEFIEAARALKADGRQINFLLAGTTDPGNPASVPPETLRDWEQEGLVRHLGHVSDMPALFQSVDIVTLPSYREGLPKGLIEAAACGVALVTTDVPGCREVVDDGVDGLMVPAKDGVALARAIARLQDDPALRGRLGQAARAKALALFDERIVIERTIAVYRELLAD